MNRFWAFTYNIRDPDDVEIFLHRLGDCVRGAVCQMEVGDEDQPHLQGYLELADQQRLAWLKTHIDEFCHFEPRVKSRDANIRYCTKEDTRVDGPWFIGDLEVTQGKRTDLHDAVRTMKTLGWDAFVDAHPVVYVKYHRGMMALSQESIAMRHGTLLCRPEVWFLHGATGSGKTRFAFAVGGDSTYMKDPTHRWWDGYNGTSAVCVDDYTAELKTGIGLEYLLRLTDLYPIRVEVKCSTIPFNPRKIFITSNFTLEQLFPQNPQLDALKRRIDHVIEFPLQEI